MEKEVRSKLNWAIFIVLGVLVVDQILKIYIKTHFALVSEPVYVFGEWFQIKFVENNGMAFGMEFGGVAGKLLLTTFRIVAVTAIGWFIVKLAKEKEKLGVIICISLILAGALGNIIDSVFYGQIFNEGIYEPATMFPENGYAPLLQGRVVDMFYFPMFTGNYPAWFPVKGGDEFIFFRPIFNIADASISIGVVSILVFYREVFKK